MAERPAWEGYLSEHHDEHLAQLFELLRIPSVSALPQHAGDVRAAAEWVAEALREVGVPKVEIMPSNGNPVVYGEWVVDASKPTALI
ncbi:MAG TPA: peptidase M20, partial [Chloroflexi bacterium]|nr:peptidase M20 [Chloroflexota bacterium]